MKAKYAEIIQNKNGPVRVIPLKVGQFVETKEGGLLQIVNNEVKARLIAGEWAVIEVPEKPARTLAKFLRPMIPSYELAAITGTVPQTRPDIVKKVWQYIKKKDLQDKKNKRMIHTDELLSPIFGKGSVSMFEMTKLLSKHLKEQKR